jgi:hypothetical protein
MISNGRGPQIADIAAPGIGPSTNLRRDQKESASLNFLVAKLVDDVLRYKHSIVSSGLSAVRSCAGAKGQQSPPSRWIGSLGLPCT